MVFEYASLKGTLNGMDTTAITDIADYIVNETHYELPPMTPFVGRNFNVTRAGIHADGLMKDEEIYNIFDTAKLLNKPPYVSVSASSGLAGIACWINNFYSLAGEQCIGKKDPAVLKIKEWVDKEYESGRVTVISDDELKALTEKYLPDIARK